MNASYCHFFLEGFKARDTHPSSETSKLPYTMSETGTVGRCIASIHLALTFIGGGASGCIVRWFHH